MRSNHENPDSPIHDPEMSDNTCALCASVGARSKTLSDGSGATRSTRDATTALVAAARDGSSTAWAELYQNHKRGVRAVLLARAPLSDVDDLMQDVFTRALQRLDTLRNDRAFSAWLTTIARHRATDAHRRRARREAVPLPDVASRSVPFAEAREVLEAVRALPDAFREPLLMRLVGGMSGPEIAERLDMTPGSVRVNLHRGMRKLRYALGTQQERP